jgi:hypothetical protein
MSVAARGNDGAQGTTPRSKFGALLRCERSETAALASSATPTASLEDLTFAELTIELCDGRPSDVERQGTLFGHGRFCPWTAVVVDIRDP